MYKDIEWKIMKMNEEQAFFLSFILCDLSNKLRKLNDFPK